MYKGVGVRLAGFISFFFTKVSLKPNYSFSYDNQKRGRGGGSGEPPEPPLGPPLLLMAI